MEIEDLNLTPAEAAFRDEVRDFFGSNLTPELRRAAQLTTWTFAEFEYGRQWQRILHRKGWGAPLWPAEYGGAGWTPRQRLIWELEKARAQPPEVMRMGRDYAAPCIMKFGSAAQKEYFLPRILSGDDWWAQGYSEPGAGSDLAALRLAADSVGDHYVLNGSKLWTTFAHHANRIFLLARTGRSEHKQWGITFLLIDMDSPGIEVRPIINLAGEHDFNQVFFTNVRVPKERRLGEEHEGWAVARYLLLYEHGAGIVRAAAELRRRVAWVSGLLRAESDGQGSNLHDDMDCAHRLAELAIGVEAVDFAADQLVLTADPAASPGAAAELLNIRMRELDQALTELAVAAVGYYGLVDQKDARRVVTDVAAIGPPHALMPMAVFLGQRGATIAGGTPDIHRNNLSKSLLR